MQDTLSVPVYIPLYKVLQHSRRLESVKIIKIEVEIIRLARKIKGSGAHTIVLRCLYIAERDAVLTVVCQDKK